MSGRLFGLAAGLALVAVASVTPGWAQTSGGAGAPALAAGGAAADGSGLHTTWGDPDLQGIWDYRTITPLERPRNLADREFLSDNEVQELEAAAAARLDEAPDDGSGGFVTVHAPYWTDPGRYVLEDKRTSLIIDPPDGRIPAMTAQAQERQAMARAKAATHGPADSWLDRSTAERCVTYGLPRASLPTLYNNNIQIVQAPGYVAIVHEMIHETRVVPLESRAPLSDDIRQWFGDSRGWWEGDTLVVETKNFTDKAEYRGSSTNLHLLERYTRVDQETLGYEITVSDPTTWEQSWTAAFPMRPTEGFIYEYACHEGNYGLLDILEVARDEDKGVAQAGQ